MLNFDNLYFLILIGISILDKQPKIENKYTFID